jgi:hypothetical protein
MGYFMPVAECVANGFFLAYFSISLDQVYNSTKTTRHSYSLTILN